MSEPACLETADGQRLAYCHRPGRDPGILFCPGFHSDMQGEKALALQAWCVESGRQFTRFDYFGHGASSGQVERGRIGRWAADTLAVLDAITRGPQVIVGSSMGGWLMLLAALTRPARVRGLVGIASAPDFTRMMRETLLVGAAAEQLRREGFCDLPSHYPGEDSYRIEQGFFDEAEAHCLLHEKIPIDVPVRLLHGQADADVPWERSIAVAKCLTSSDVEVQLIKDGDHRLSRPEDLRRLVNTARDLLAKLGLNPPGSKAGADAEHAGGDD